MNQQPVAWKWCGNLPKALKLQNGQYPPREGKRNRETDRERERESARERERERQRERGRKWAFE
jgi:hypothetical protein